MDDRTLEAANRFEENHRDRAIAEAKQQAMQPHTYTVAVIRSGKPEWLSVTAAGSEARAVQLRQNGVDIARDQWAAGYLDRNRTPQLCGNSEEAKRLVREDLRRPGRRR